MIYVVEGPNAAGKSTLAARLSSVLRIPIYVDLGRKVAQRAGASGGELQAMTPCFDLLVEQVGRNHDFVIDRYWPTTIVFKRLDPRRPPLPEYLAMGPGGRARRGQEEEVLFQVRADEERILSRLRARNEPADPERVRREIAIYDEVFDEIRDAGVPVIVVDGTRGLPGPEGL